MRIGDFIILLNRYKDYIPHHLPAFGEYYKGNILSSFERVSAGIATPSKLEL